MSYQPPPAPLTQGQQPPPPGYYPPPPSNGIAVAAMVCGIVGALIALIPLLGIIGLILGVLALVFGLLGNSRARREPAVGRRGMAISGIVLGPVAIALGIVGLVIVGEAFEDLDKDLRSIGRPSQQSKISDSEYNAVRHGDSKRSVIERLGEPESEDSTRYPGAPRFNVPAERSDCLYYSLEGRGALQPGSSVQFCFTNGRLDSKSTF